MWKIFWIHFNEFKIIYISSQFFTCLLSPCLFIPGLIPTLKSSEDEIGNEHQCINSILGRYGLSCICCQGACKLIHLFISKNFIYIKKILLYFFLYHFVPFTSSPLRLSLYCCLCPSVLCPFCSIRLPPNLLLCHSCHPALYL